jgi:threonine dehydratase
LKELRAWYSEFASTEPATVQLDDVLEARTLIAPFVHRTPLFGSATLSRLTGTTLTLKAENLQKTGAFKVRGAINALSRLDDESRRRGVIGVSAGNHGMALAYAAGLLGTRATVVMPETATRAKINAIQGYGGRTVLVDGRRLMESMEEVCRQEGQTFIHPFEHPRVIAGQGTVGLELVEDVPDVEAVIVPVGGGGLISGIATAVKARAPGALVIGVEPEGSACVSQSLSHGEPMRLESFATVADGLNAPWSGPNTLAIIRRCVDGVITVTDEEILEALAVILERTKLLVEPAGAAAVAALLRHKIPQVAGKKVLAILSGGNVDPSRLVEFVGAR